MTHLGISVYPDIRPLEEIKDYFVKMLGKVVSEVKALFIPTAAIDAGAIEVLPKCMG